MPGDEVGLFEDGRAVDADRELAAAAESIEDDAFGVDGEAGEWVVESGDGGADCVVAIGFSEDGVAGRAGFEGEGALAGGGAEFVEREALVDPFGAVEAVEAGRGENEGVALAFGELAQAGVDVAAEFDELKVRTQGEELGAAAGAGGADAAVHREGV